MSTHPHKPSLWALLILLGSTAGNSLLAAETVRVRLDSGRELTAAIDVRTDDTQLWLRYGNDAATIIRPVAWERIREAFHNDMPVTVDELRELAMAAAAAEQPAEPATKTIVVPPAEPAATTDSDGNSQAAASYAQRATQALGMTRRIRSVQFDAHLANWDGDVEHDGLLLRLTPFDANGAPTPGNGMLHVEFVAFRWRNFYDVPRGRGQSPEQLGRWTVRIRAEDFQRGSTVVKLPFQTAHPEFDTNWHTHGLVHVRLVVPGHGVFEHSQDGVRTRPFSPLRDALQLQQGVRFLPNERTGRAQRVQD